MLYVIQYNDIFKIGFTTSEENIEKYYKQKYPGSKLIKTIEGNRIDLQKIQNQIGKQNWYSSNVLDVFDKYVTDAWDNWERVKFIINEAVNDIINNYLNGEFDEYKLSKYDADICRSFFDRTENLKEPEDYMKYNHMRMYLIEGRSYNFMLMEFMCKHWIDYELVPTICDNIVKYRTNELNKTMKAIDKVIENAITNKIEIQKLLNEVNDEVNLFLDIM